MTIIDKGDYKIKKWGKDIDGEFIVDGYSYKGRKPLLKALEGLKAMMVKGFVGEVNEVDIQVLDRRIVGAELAIDIQCTENKNRGKAVLKLYGPSTKKQNVIMATRYKGSDIEYVIMLAEKVVEPLIIRFLNEDKVDENKGSDKNESIKCNFCEKTAKTTAGLKGHMTKMHGNNKTRKSYNSDDVGVTKDNDEARKIINLLLDDIVNNTEEASETNGKESKRYQNNCDKCDFTANTNKRYEAIQLIKKHKVEDCVNRTIRLSNKCSNCEFEAINSMLIKRHMRDEHDVKTFSTSPPAKKLRKHKDIEKMEVDDIEDVDMKTISEAHMIDEVEKRILKERSDRVDEKIVEKAIRDEEKEAENKNKKIKEDAKRKEEECKMMEQLQQLNKKRKQSLKDQRKNTNKKKQKETDVNGDNIKEELEISDNENIKEVPKNCKHLVGPNDLIYKVPGDGCCGPNSAAAFLFHDEKLRTKMNIFMSNYWDKKYKNITQCSPGHPFERKIGNKMVKFSNPEDLKEFLKTEEAAYMWTDSEDLAVLSDLFQIEIKIITTKGTKDENPTVNWIHPDPNMKEFAELKNVDLDIMVLYHENDCHFNLVIDKHSDLAVKGSITSRLNVGNMKNNDKKDKPDVKDTKDSDILKLKKELKECKESKNMLEKKYLECVKELKVKTEEVEILKIEVNDVRMIIKLRDELDKEQLNNAIEGKNSLTGTEKLSTCEKSGFSSPVKKDMIKHARKEHSESHVTNNKSRFQTIRKDDEKNGNENAPDSLKEELRLLSCDICKFETTSTRGITEHMQVKHTSEEHEEEFNCKKCDYQTNNEPQLKKHFTLKHTLKGLKEDEEIICRNCDEKFQGKRSLLIHRKQKHRNSVADCKNYQEGKCLFTEEKCYWNHSLKDKESNGQVECFNCGKTFKCKNDMMIHRKNEHESMVRICKEFIENNCRLRKQFCWFLHKDEEMEIEPSININKSENHENEKDCPSVFQKISGNKEPPLSEEMRNQKMK